MTFLEALKTGRPMRRANEYWDKPWLYLGYETGLTHETPCWHNVHTGARAGIPKDDYLAEDWEVMP